MTSICATITDTRGLQYCRKWTDKREKIVMKSQQVPLHEAVRPNCHPDQAGNIGQNMHALGDEIEQNAPELYITVSDTAESGSTYWQAVVAALQQIRSVNGDTYGLAIRHIMKLARHT